MHLYSTNPTNCFTNIGPVNVEITVCPTKIDKKININQMQGKANDKKGRPMRQKLVRLFTEIVESLLNDKLSE